MSTFNSITAVLFCQLISVSCMLLMSRPHLLAHWDLHLKNIICMRWMQKQYSHQVAVTQTDSQGPVLKLSTAETPYWECCAPKRAAAEQTGFNLPAAGQSWFLHTLVPSWSSQFKGVSKRQLCHEVTGVTFECLFQSSHRKLHLPARTWTAQPSAPRGFQIRATTGWRRLFPKGLAVCYTLPQSRVGRRMSGHSLWSRKGSPGNSQSTGSHLPVCKGHAMAQGRGHLYKCLSSQVSQACPPKALTAQCFKCFRIGLHKNKMIFNCFTSPS